MTASRQQQDKRYSKANYMDGGGNNQLSTGALEFTFRTLQILRTIFLFLGFWL